MNRGGKIGVLLVNLGTPDSPSGYDVYRYLIEFLMDSRVIDKSWLSRQFLVRGVIVPFRFRQSAQCYRAIWTSQGSPLKVYGYRVQELLQKQLGKNYYVELGMRYRHPSIEQALKNLVHSQVRQIIVLPLFPHYASATTGSVHQKVMDLISRYEVIPEMVFISHYGTHPKLIEAFCAVAGDHSIKDYDHVIFSFHGLPKQQIIKADEQGGCLQSSECCQKPSVQNKYCYSAQCYATAKALADACKIPVEKHSVVFQSRLGKDPWLRPYFSEMIEKLAHQGKKKVLVFCSSFVCDCLETLYEIGVEYAAEFKKAGGEQLDLVPGLNDHPKWIETLEAIVKEKTMETICPTSLV